MFKKSIFIFFVSCALVLAGCASPTVVAVKKTGDSSLNCEQLKIAIDEANEFELNARKERKVTGTNVAAALLFWPALLATYSNTEEAINAAKERKVFLTKIADEKMCKY
jgi:ABC-type oligopeptide transport system substrate-binding subunit